MSKQTLTLITSLMIAAIIGSVQAQSLIVNGGFETGNFTGWTTNGNVGFTSVSVNYAQTGNYGAQFGPIGSQGFLSQTLATTPGATYQVDFWLRNNGGTPSLFTLNWDGNQIYSLADSASFVWTSYSFQEVASTASTIITFGFRQDPDFFGLDNVSVTDITPVPEPSTLALAGLAGVGMFFALRRRK